MIAVDTNVIVRLMVEDDALQTRRAIRLIDQAAEKDEVAYVSDIVLCELEWVLSAAYPVPRTRILSALTALVADQRFCFEDAGRVSASLDLYQDNRGDLADYLLGLEAEAAGARTTFTFDRSLGGDTRFTLLRG